MCDSIRGIIDEHLSNISYIEFNLITIVVSINIVPLSVFLIVTDSPKSR
jgi:hypothetical protein